MVAAATAVVAAVIVGARRGALTHEARETQETREAAPVRSGAAAADESGAVLTES